MMRIGLIDANDMLAEVECDDRVFNIGMSWNEEGALWTMSVRDLNFSIIASGIAVVPNWPLLRQVRRPESPDGEFAVDAAPGARLGRQSFVTGAATLYYLSPIDIA